MGKITVRIGLDIDREEKDLLARCGKITGKGGYDDYFVLLPSRLKVERFRKSLLSPDGIPGILGERTGTFFTLAKSVLSVNHRFCNELPFGLKSLLVFEVLQDVIKVQPDDERLGGCLPGLVNTMSSAIREFKEALLLPDDLKNYLSEIRNPNFSLLYRVFSRYQGYLERKGLVDREDIFLAAIECLDQNDPPFHRLGRRLVLLGFYDLNPLQLAFFRHLSELVNEVEVIFPVPETMMSHRIPRQFLDSLVGMGADVRKDVRNTFKEKGEGLPGIEIVELPDPLRESEYVAKRIKKEVLARGGRLDEIDVVAIRSSGYERSLRASFDRYGVPVNGLGSVPILSNPALKILLSCLESVWQEYERHSILKLLSSSYLAAGIWGDRGEEPGPVLRDLLELTRVSRGDEEWLYRLGKLKEEITRGNLWERYTGLYQRDFLSARLESYREKPEELLRICDGVERLIGILRCIPPSSTLKGYVEVLFQLAGKLRLVEGILSQKGNEVKARDLRALQAFWDCLGSWEDCLSGEDHISLIGFQSLINSILRTIKYRARIGDEGGVYLIDPLEKRHHSSIVTVVCGMIEGFFAVTPSKQEVLSDPLRVEINTTAKREALKLSTRRKEEDDLIFDILLFRSAGRLVMTYPTLDSQSREVIRSRYIDRLAEGKSVTLTRIPPAGIIPDASQIYDRKELVSYLVPTLSSGEWRQKVKDGCKDLEEFQPMLSGVRGRILIERARKSGTGKGYDGQFVGGEILKDLGERFGENCVYTPSLLGNYITCPFLFMVGDVWGLEGREDRGIGMSSSDKGRIIHRILNLFYRHFLEEGSFSWDDVEDSLPILEEIADSILGEYYEVDYLGPRGLMDIQGKELKRELLDFVLKDIEISRELRATPLLLEYAIYTGEEGVYLETSAGEIKIGGRVDRVDVLESPGNGHIVMDYKTGYSASPREIREGKNLQVPLYIIGLEKKGFNILMGFYYHIKERKRKAEMGPGRELISRKGSRGDLDWDFIQELVIGKIGEVVTSITGGDFRANPPDCPSYCDLKDICRLESYKRRKRGWRRRV